MFALLPHGRKTNQSLSGNPKTIVKFLTAMALLSIAGAASAQVYGEAAYPGLNFSESSTGADANIGALGVNIGYEINKHLAVEALIAAGVKDDTATVTGVSVNVGPKHPIGVYLKPKATIGENFEVYAKLGWADTKVEFSGPGGSASGSDSDFSYGVGAQYNFSPKSYVSAGYLKLDNKNTVDIDGWTISVGYRFQTAYPRKPGPPLGGPFCFSCERDVSRFFSSPRTAATRKGCSALPPPSHPRAARRETR